MDLAVGLLLGQLASSALPYLVESIGKVKRPKRVDVKKAMSEAHTCRPVVPYHAPRPYTEGRVKALFIGINYTGRKGQLSGCINDVKQMLNTLQQIQFPISSCCILVDDPRFPNYTAMPTRANIIKHMAWLVYDARPGDVLFFHYSGHGAETTGGRDSEEENDQCLIPLDYEKEGSILDDDLFELMVKGLPAGVRMTAVFDCCHSASLLDLPFAFVAGRNALSSHRQEMRMVRKGNFSRADVVMFSGCEDSGTSADVQNTASFGNGTRVPGGAATQALTWALLNTSGYNYADIFMRMRDVLRNKGYKQVPQLSSSKPIDLYKPFSLFGTLTMNTNLIQNVPVEYTNAWNAQPPQHSYPQWPQQQQVPVPTPQNDGPVMGIPISSSTDDRNSGNPPAAAAPTSVVPPVQYPSQPPSHQPQQGYYSAPQQYPPQQGYYSAPQQYPPQQSYYPAPQQYPPQQSYYPAPQQYPPQQSYYPAPQQYPPQQSYYPAPQQYPPQQSYYSAPQQQPPQQGYYSAPQQYPPQQSRPAQAQKPSRSGYPIDFLKGSK